jgi:hypothetical protein
MDGLRFDALTRALSRATSRRSALAAALAGLLTLGSVEAKRRKVTLCHNGQTLSVRRRAKRKHLRHGDTLGPCPEPVVCPPGQKSCQGRCIAANQCCTATDCPTIAALVCAEQRCISGSCTTVNTANGERGPRCSGVQEVCQDGQCVCVPDCNGGTTCATGDGCGGTCTCNDASFCNEGVCVACDPPCPAGQRCVHGTCTCDPFNNTCPNEVDGQCTCGAFVATPFAAACVDRNSACDLDKPCDTNEDCPVGSVCLLGCADPPAPNPRRCSTPCIPV